MKAICRQGLNEPLSALLQRLNPLLPGWAKYFRFGVSKATFSYLRTYSWARVVSWLSRKHPRAKWEWQWLRRHYLPRWRPMDGNVTMFNPAAVPISYAHYRQVVDATPWAAKVVVNPTT